MPNFRRVYIKGGVYFFTVVTANRQPILIKNIQLVRDAFQYVHARHPFIIDAAVILPDHLHCIWTLPENDDDYSMRWRLLKSYFSHHLSEQKDNKFNKSNRSIWQKRYWEHMIRDEYDYNRHVDYIHYNPVKHGYVQHVADWNYSSFQNFVRKGMYEQNWSNPVDMDMDFE